MPDDAPATRSEAPIIAFFDVDNTLLRGASMFHLAKAAFRMRILTVRDIVRFFWQQTTFLFVGENIRHLSKIKERGLQLIAGRTVDEVTRMSIDVFDRDIRPRLWPESVALAREHVAKGHTVWLITAAPQLTADVIAERLGLSGARGTRFAEVDGVFTGQFEGTVVHGEEKAVTARDLARELGADLVDCWAYSDSSNDIPLLTLVGNRVVVNPDSRLAAHAKEQGWRVLHLRPSSIREAQRRVRQEAKATTSRRKGRPRTEEKR